MELEWYLRDHLFRESKQGRRSFQTSAIPEEMVRLYLKYRNVPPVELANTMSAVIKRLVMLGVLQAGGDNVELAGGLTRLRCDKCFYISYLSPAEQRNCLRCDSSELHDFPRAA